MPSDQLDTLLSEQRRFPPPESFVAQANGSRALQHAAERDREGFWAEQARALEWISPWNRVLEWKPPHAKWFVGGKLNVAVNCVDRHVDGPRRNKAALIWEGEPGDRRMLTYWDLVPRGQQDRQRAQAAGRRQGRPRRRSTCRMIPEAGDRHARVRADRRRPLASSSAASPPRRSATGSTTRRRRCSSRRTAAIRRGRSSRSSAIADEAMEHTPSIEHCVVVRRRAAPERTSPSPTWSKAATTGGTAYGRGRVRRVRAEPDGRRGHALHPLHLGHDGKAEGDRPHHRRLSHPGRGDDQVRLRPQAEDVFWCTADIGWVTGHSYVVYGPLANGATVFMYEGAPDWPEPDRFWSADRALRGDGALHRSHRDPGVHEVRHGASGPPRSLQPPAAGLGGRADQPGSVDLVSRPTSAAAAARSWIPGGRRRPAGS